MTNEQMQDRRDANSMLNWEQGRAQYEPREMRNLKRAFWGEGLAQLRESTEDNFNCQVETKPCQRWCGAIPCEGTQ